MLAGNLCLAIGPWLVRLADVGPVAAGFWRLALAAPILLLLAFRGRAGGEIARLPRGLVALLLLGGLFFAADLACWHLGILRTRLANASLFGNVSAFFFAAYGFVVARRLPGRLQVAAMLLALAGTLLLLGRSWEMSRATLVGDALCIAAGLLYTFYLIAIDRGRAAAGPWPTLALATVAGIAPLLLTALALGERVVPGNWTPVILLALGSQLLGQGFIVYAIGLLPPIVTGLGFLTQPAIGAAIGWIVYGERLGLADLAGAAAIAVALVLVRAAR